MSASGKAAAIVDWCATYGGTPPKLSAMPEGIGDTGVQIVSNDYEREKFINGKARRRYTVTLQYMADWSDGNDVINREAMRYGEDWLDWVSEQWKAGNVPAFGSGANITKIEPLYNSPEVAAVYQSDALARYQFSAAIDYIE